MASCVGLDIVNLIESTALTMVKSLYGSAAGTFYEIMVAGVGMSTAIQLTREAIGGAFDWQRHVWRIVLLVLAETLLRDPSLYETYIFYPVTDLLYGWASQLFSGGSSSDAHGLGILVCGLDDSAKQSFTLASLLAQQSYKNILYSLLIMIEWILLTGAFLINVIGGYLYFLIPYALGPAFVASIVFEPTRRFALGAVDMMISGGAYVILGALGVGLFQQAISTLLVDGNITDLFSRNLKDFNTIQSNAFWMLIVSPIVGLYLIYSCGKFAAYLSNRIEAGGGFAGAVNAGARIASAVASGGASEAAQSKPSSSSSQQGSQGGQQGN